jgi:hypothetical protein
MTPNVWRMGTLPKMNEKIVSEVLMVFEFFHFMWVFLMEVINVFYINFADNLCNNASISQLPLHVSVVPTEKSKWSNDSMYFPGGINGQDDQLHGTYQLLPLHEQ